MWLFCPTTHTLVNMAEALGSKFKERKRYYFTTNITKVSEIAAVAHQFRGELATVSRFLL